MKIKILVVVLSIIMLVSFVSAFVILVATGVKFSGKEIQIDATQVEKAEGINSISINSLNSEIIILPTDENEIKAHLYGTTTAPKEENKPTLEAKKVGSTYEIKVNYPNNIFAIGFLMNKIKLEILVPKAFKDNISVDTTSGKITASDLNMNDLKLKNMSGGIKLSGVTANNISVDCTSGNIELQNVSSKVTSVKSMSGNSLLEGKLGDLTLNSTSGDVRATYSEFDNNVAISSMSGKIAVKLPSQAQFKLKAKAVSGDVRCDFDLSDKSEGHNFMNGTAGTSGKTININATSGDIEIRK